MAMKMKPIKLLVLLAFVAGGAYLYMNFGGLITRTAERIASDALGVKVNIGSVNVSLSDKKVTVSTLEIGNPPGYRKAHAMTADSISITLNDASQKLIDFKDVEVKGSVVNLEVNDKGGMNLNDLKKLAGRKEQKESVGSEQIRVIVQHMVIDASVINTTIPMLNRETSIRMPAVNFSNIGKGGGAQAGDVIVQIMNKYLSEVQRTASSEGLLKGIPGMDTSTLDDVKGTLDDAAKGMQGLFR